ncbi:hypothetical protein [Halococcus saccharolyticus]|uniref:Big-1 domain-containing protein n=1 Tax=Halococcus saccharolyticus DSM 5350 TaxID=1227455 RepID=M0MRC4_9EURY|nr:hypothetical protein [Halococcus saccharolyticus]EMA46990.1 hypothetical protein C449_03119 [Halococcus saccharolyticus DSM 5350]
MFEPLTQRLERLQEDERGVSPVVGFVLIFALIMLVFTIYQADVVPAQNKEVEFEHSQVVEADMGQLNDAIQEASTSGLPQSATVATGLQYPSRALAINPGNPSGALETSGTQQVEISGLSGSSGYWSSSSRDPFETRLVSYQSNYNQMQQETEYTVENGLLVKDYSPEDATSDDFALGSDGTMISENGEQINLVLVGGEYQESSITSSVTATPVSTSTEYHQLESNSGMIRVPTSLSEDVWQNEIVDGAAGIQSVTVSEGVATLNLKDQEYELRLTKVSLRTSTEPSATYLKSESPFDPSETIDTTVGESETFTVSVRDKFGNLYTSDDVMISADKNGAAGNLSSNSQSPNDEGRATFTYKPADTDAGTVEIELSINGGGEDYESVTYELNVSDGSDGNGDGTAPAFSPGDLTNGYQLGVIVKSASADEVVFENIGSKDVTATAVRVSGDFRRQGNSGGSPPETVSFAGKNIELNGNLTSLGSDEYPITAGDSTSVSFDPNTQKSVKGGFLIITVQYEYTQDGETETTAATYAVAIGQ